MKSVFLIALLVAAVAYASADDSKPFISAETNEIINAVNSNPHATWKAGINSFLEDKTVGEVKELLGAFDMTPPQDIDIVNHETVADSAIPEEFDSRTAWPDSIHAIRNQAKCGSCWAFGATEAFSDRLAIATKNKVKDVLSPQWMVSCAGFPNQGCRGGIPFYAWMYMWHTGVATDACVPYQATEGQSIACPKKCADGSDIKLHKLSKFYKVGGFFTGDAKAIQKEIMTNGPVEGGFKVYKDFMNYKSGVYQHTTGELLGGHAIKIVGWGVEDSTPYWLVANSWDTTWGLDGFFKIKRGTNECGIERTVYGGLPAETA